MNIAVIGIGHVGLVTGLVFADKGHTVICLEKVETIRDNLNKGISHIYEPGIEDLLKKCLAGENFSVVASNQDQLEGSDVVFICVNTPMGPNGIDFSQLKETLETTGKAIARSKNYITVVIKSTVVPGTTSGFAREILESVSGKKCHRDFGLATNPEFLREGNGIDDFLHADRIIIGADHPMAEDALLSIYEPWDCDRVMVNSNTAEFIKYYSNNLLSLLISFTNEMANVAGTDERIDYRKVLDGVSSDKRLSPILEDNTRVFPGILSYLVPGPGYGGSCLPKDLEAFAYFANQRGIHIPVLDGVMKTNAAQANSVLDLMKRNIGDLDGKAILILGMTHKPDTNDIRDSASIRIAKLLAAENATLILHDPVAGNKVGRMFSDRNNISVAQDWKGALLNADIILLMTGWPEYKQLAEPELSSSINGKQLVDTRYFYNENDFELSHYISF